MGFILDYNEWTQSDFSLLLCQFSPNQQIRSHLPGTDTHTVCGDSHITYGHLASYTHTYTANCHGPNHQPTDTGPRAGRPSVSMKGSWENAAATSWIYGLQNPRTWRLFPFQLTITRIQSCSLNFLGSAENMYGNILVFVRKWLAEWFRNFTQQGQEVWLRYRPGRRFPI